MKSFALLVLSVFTLTSAYPQEPTPIAPALTTGICPTVTATSTVCPFQCTWPPCAIMSTLTAHCGCTDPPPMVTVSWTCSDGCSAKAPCPTLYTVSRVTDCTGPTSSSTSKSSSSSSS